MNKSIPLAIALPLLFGPLGVLYVDKKLGVTMLCGAVILSLATLIPFGHHAELAEIRLVAFVVLIIACVGVSVGEALHINKSTKAH